MHTRTEQLIALRDGEPMDARVAEHVEGCAQCQRALTLLRERQQELRDLPLQEPSAQVLANIRTRISGPARRRQQAAVAATLVAVALLVVTWASVSVRLNNGGEALGVPDTLAGSEAAQMTAANTATRELMRRSQALEAVYAQLAEVPVAPLATSTTSALDALRDRLALLDYGLNQSQLDPAVRRHLEQLWQRRVDTLQSMVGVQYAELARQGYHSFQVLPASYLEEDVIRW